MTRVLIVDDNKANLYLLESMLKGNGFAVVQAGNGEEALERARQDPPDLVITDILMPKMDGFELCRRWKADLVLKQVPFIFYTATYTDPRDEKFAMSLGAERFLTKPMKPDALLKEIRDILAGSAGGQPASSPRPLGDEMEILRQYNEVLFRKLEKKVLQLESEIEERKTIQRQLEAAIKELEQKNAELARFTYTVSHELRTPLITIQGFSGLIEREAALGSDPAELISYVRRITDAVSALDAQLADLLKLTRAGKSIGPRTPIAFGVLAREAAETALRLHPPGTIRVVIDENMPCVEVDPARVREALVNLLENAIKFRGQGPDPHIRIGIDRSRPEPVFFVQDNGIGIDPKYLERIFNLFEKLDGSTEGTGIGLAIARRIIEAHGGGIWAESEGVGKGATFFFTLPMPETPGTDNDKNA